MREGNGKNVLIGVLVAVVLFMAIGYAAFASTLNINGSAAVTGTWGVEFTDLTKAITGEATEKTVATFDATTVTFDVELHAPGDKVVYTITVENTGSITAKLASISAPNLDGTDPIVYSLNGIAVNDVLAAGATKTITVTVEYDSSVTEVPEEGYSKALAVTLNFVQNA